MKKPIKMPLRRHHDDDYWDEIAIDAGMAHLRAFVVPRYKTSGFSGDEWRIHAELSVVDDSKKRPLVGRPYNSMKHLVEYAPHFVFSEARNLLLTRKNAVMVVKRKGHVLMRQRFATFGDAAMGIGWHIVNCNEGNDVKWRHLTDEEELAHCQQVGCKEKPRNFYRLKKLQLSPQHSLMIKPEYDFVGQFTWYCARHTCRGDASFEDCDKNLVLVKGSGSKAVRPEDERAATFGGVIDLTSKQKRRRKK